MTWLEYTISAIWLRGVYLVCCLLPIRQDKVVFASARAGHLEGNLRFIHEAIKNQCPELKPVLLLERYSYDLLGKIAYFCRMVRGTYHLATARYVIVDNAYLPIHVGPHRRETKVFQVWHAAGALKVFGVDAPASNRKIEGRFIHRYYDYVIVGSDVAVGPYASALRTPESQVLPIGVARTDFFFDAALMENARQRILDAHPEFVNRRVVLYAPTFRGQGVEKRPGQRLDAAKLRAALPAEYVLVHKLHPVFDARQIDAQGYDAVIGDEFDINELFTVTDILITDYSSSIFEYVLMRKPMILLVDDLDEYSADPGLYIDYRTKMVGSLAFDSAEVANLILAEKFDLSAYDDFIERECQYADGSASTRFVKFLSGH